MKGSDALDYSRNLILTLIQNGFFNIFEIAQVRKEVTSSDFKYQSYNFKQHFTCILEYVLNNQGTTSKQHVHKIKSADDPDSVHIAFATNAIFWISYSCLETASVMQATADGKYQDLAMDL